MTTKGKRTAPRRYYLLWRGKNLGWNEDLWSRQPSWAPPEWKIPYRLEDLKTGEILASNLDFRQVLFVTQSTWPKRQAAARALQRYYAPKPPKKPVDRAAKLRAAEKRWLTKFRTAETKLKKIRAALRRLERAGTAGVSPAPQVPQTL